ncbi:MAG: tripartite tricarboxylate transporter permease [Candidatus Diapherotrites archaeon]
MIELLIWILAGCCCGVITGTLPGLHVNTLAFLLMLAFADMPTGIAAFIVSMAVTHSFYDFIPSIVLGVPDEDNYLSVLPGHRYFLKGLAYKAIMLTAIGGLLGTIFLSLIAPLFIFFVENAKNFMPIFIPWILVLVLVLVVLASKRKAQTAFVVLMSALLGIAVITNLSMKNGVTAIVLGIFSMSTLLISLSGRSCLRKQKLYLGKMGAENALQGSLLAVIGSAIVSVLPSMGPNHAAFILRKIFGKIKNEAYMVMIGGINTCNLLFSLLVLQMVGKTRTGVALALRPFVENNSNALILFVGVGFVAASFSVISISFIAKQILKNLPKVPYKKLNAATFFGICVFILLFGGLFELIVSLVACAIGIYAATAKVARSSCMAFLIVPTIIVYLGL